MSQRFLTPISLNPSSSRLTLLPITSQEGWKADVQGSTSSTREKGENALILRQELFVFKCKKSSRCLIQAIEQRGTDVGFFLSVLFFVGVTGKVWIMACWEGKIFEPDSQGSANAPFYALCSLVFNFAVLASDGPHMLMFGKFTG